MLFILLNLIILLNNFVNSQPAKIKENMLNTQAILKKRGLDMEGFNCIFILCILIPAIFVIVIYTLVIVAKKNVEKSELKRAQNHNASSLNSMNFSSRNLLYSGRSTFNESKHSQTHNENLGDYTPKINTPKINATEMNMNNNIYGAGYNMSLPNNADVVNNMNNNEVNDINSQLLMTKNYRMQGYRTSIIPNMTSPMSSPYIQEQQYKLDLPEETSTPVVNEQKTKSYKVPTIPGIEDPIDNVINNRDYQGKTSYGYNKSYNEIKKLEQRISVNPPLQDWNDSYHTIDETEGKNVNKKDKNKKNKQGTDPLAKNHKESKIPNEYVMSISPPKNQAISEKEKVNIIEQYDSSSKSDTNSSNTSQSNNSEKYVKRLPSKPTQAYYSEKYMKQTQSNPPENYIRSMQSSPSQAYIKNMQSSPSPVYYKNVPTSPSQTYYKNVPTSPSQTYFKNLPPSPSQSYLKNLQSSPSPVYVKNVPPSTSQAYVRSMQSSPSQPYTSPKQNYVRVMPSSPYQGYAQSIPYNNYAKRYRE